MSRVNIPTQDSLYGPWITTFASVATANITALGMTSGQALALTGLATAFNDAYEDATEKKTAAQGAVATKDLIRATSEEQFRAAGKLINANMSVSTALKAELGISVTPSVVSPVTPPTELVAIGYDTGFNKLTWKRNGNMAGTTFLIESRLGGSASWSFVAVTNKTKFMHSGQIPGVEITYRVTAQRDDLQSMPSNQSTLYGPEESETLTLKQAA